MVTMAYSLRLDVEARAPNEPCRATHTLDRRQATF